MMDGDFQTGITFQEGEVGRYIRFANQEVFNRPSVKSIHEIEVNKS